MAAPSRVTYGDTPYVPCYMITVPMIVGPLCPAVSVTVWFDGADHVLTPIYDVILFTIS